MNDKPPQTLQPNQSLPKISSPQWTMYSPPSKTRFATAPRDQTHPEQSTPGTALSSEFARPLRLVILGEAPGADEERAGLPFIGKTGELMRRYLFPQSGLDIDEWHILNVFTSRPPNNDLDLWTANKTELKKLGVLPRGTPLRKSRYLLPQFWPQVEELHRRLTELQPDFILALGGTALWALTGEASISNYRGNFFQSKYGCLALATFHPASILHQWGTNMPLTWADLSKVALHLAGELPAPLSRRFCVNPTFAEIASVYAAFNRSPQTLLGVDIETSPRNAQITTISFCSDTLGICIPIWDKDARPTSCNFWPTPAEELKAWRWIKRLAELPNPKCWQNGLYDSQYLLDAPLEIRVLHAVHDTAIMQHAMQPELPKALGTLASLYLNEPAWKFMRTQDKDVNKADD